MFYGTHYTDISRLVLFKTTTRLQRRSNLKAGEIGPALHQGDKAYFRLLIHWRQQRLALDHCLEIVVEHHAHGIAGVMGTAGHVGC